MIAYLQYAVHLLRSIIIVQMNRLLFLLGLLAFSFKISAQSEWKKIESDRYNFELLFYEEPVALVDSTKLQGETLNIYSWELEVQDSLHSNQYYSIYRTAYPSDFIHSDSLFTLVEGFINSTQSSLLEDKEFSLLSSVIDERNGFPGKIFKWKSLSNGVHLQFQVYLVNNILFELSTVVREGEEQNVSIGKYFDSFKVRGLPNGSFEIKNDNREPTYSIQFKETPSLQNKVVDSDYGKLSMDIKLLEVEDPTHPNLLYMAMETKYPVAVAEEGDTYALNTFYKASIDGSLAAVNGELISINDIYYDSYLGKEYKCYYAGGQALMVYRLFYVEGSLYQHGVITNPDKDDNKDIQRFFQSFKFLRDGK